MNEYDNPDEIRVTNSAAGEVINFLQKQRVKECGHE